MLKEKGDDELVIKAVIFDLDGVLVQTEKLKSLAYAKAVQRI